MKEVSKATLQIYKRIILNVFSSEKYSWASKLDMGRSKISFPDSSIEIKERKDSFGNKKYFFNFYPERGVPEDDSLIIKARPASKEFFKIVEIERGASPLSEDYLVYIFERKPARVNFYLKVSCVLGDYEVFLRNMRSYKTWNLFVLYQKV